MTRPTVADSTATSDSGVGTGLRLVGVSKTFGGSRALDNVDLQVGRGQVHALLGSNGSGKSTLVKILAGVYQATSGGGITIGETTVPSTTITPDDSAALGMRFVHQQLGLFPHLSIADNFAAAAGFGVGPLSMIRRRELAARTRDMMDQFGIAANPAQSVGSLRPSVQTLVAIGRAMVDRENAKVLILDEPTESLPEDDTNRLLMSIRELAASGMTFVVVSHRLAEISQIADEVTVLRDGTVATAGPMSAMTRSDLVRHITGKEDAGRTGAESVRQTPPSSPASHRRASLAHQPQDASQGHPALEARAISVGSVRDLSFEVMSGEVLGIAGLVGSGRSAVLEGLFGARRLTAGRLSVDGRPVHFAHPADAVRSGIAFVPENRVGQGLFLDQPVVHNITAASLEGFFTRGSIATKTERRHASSRISSLGIKTASPGAAIATLSGGNQQKAILGRWLDTAPAILLLDEPTQGVDVGARAEIHSIINTAVANGMAVIVVSSDLEELCEMSDRILIMRRGRMSHVLDENLTVTRVADLMHEAG